MDEIEEAESKPHGKVILKIKYLGKKRKELGYEF